LNCAVRTAAGGPAPLRSVGRSHRGLVRELNEDAFLERPDLDRADCGLWAVADGMGGHQAGDVASASVVAALASPDGFANGLSAPALRTRLAEVSAELAARARASRPGSTIGSTVAVLTIQGGRYDCLWAGDSRAYRLTRGDLVQITRDHTLVQALIDAGELRPEEAAGHRQAHVITRAVGVDPLTLDRVEGDVRPGDRFLLCTDGLTGAVSEHEIARALLGGDMDTAADDLIALALARGGRDNVTVVIVEAP